MPVILGAVALIALGGGAYWLLTKVGESESGNGAALEADRPDLPNDANADLRGTTEASVEGAPSAARDAAAPSEPR